MPKHKGFTLIELIIVVVVISVLASIALPRFTKTIEHARDQEAIVNLNLIKAAELIYYNEYNSYWPPLGSSQQSVTQINSALLLNLNNNNFTYTSDDAASPDYYDARASRNKGGFNRTWRVTRDKDPYCYSGTCP